MGVKMEAGLLFLAGCVLGQVCCLEEPTCSSRCEFEARISRQLAEIQHILSSIRQERVTACRDGWLPFHGSCYLFADSDFVDFLGAEHHCRRYGAHLIHVNTEAENMFIKAELSQLHPKQWWLGIQDSELEAVWKFYGDDSVATFTDFHSGDGGDHGAEDCACFDKNNKFRWVDIVCNGVTNRRAVCEMTGL